MCSYSEFDDDDDDGDYSHVSATYANLCGGLPYGLIRLEDLARLFRKRLADSRARQRADETTV